MHGSHVIIKPMLTKRVQILSRDQDKHMRMMAHLGFQNLPLINSFSSCPSSLSFTFRSIPSHPLPLEVSLLKSR